MCKKRGRRASVYSRGDDVVFLRDFMGGENLDTIEYQTVNNWFNNEITGTNLSPQTRKIYLAYLKAFCIDLKKNPDQIINHIKTAKNPNLAIKRIHKKLAQLMAKRGLLIRSADLRLLALIRFYRCNNIEVSRELADELAHIVAKAFKPEFKRAVHA